MHVLFTAELHKYAKRRPKILGVMGKTWQRPSSLQSKMVLPPVPHLTCSLPLSSISMTVSIHWKLQKCQILLWVIQTIGECVQVIPTTVIAVLLLLASRRNSLVNVASSGLIHATHTENFSENTYFTSYHQLQPYPLLFVSSQNICHSDLSSHKEKTHPSLLLQREYITI